MTESTESGAERDPVVPNAASPEVPNPEAQHPEAQHPEAANPPAASPYEPGGYGQNPYAQNPYTQNPYTQNPYTQNPYTQGRPGQPPYAAVPPYGAYPPPMPPVAPPKVPGKADLGGAFKWSWTTFSRYTWPMLVPGLLFVVTWAIALVVMIIGMLWMVPVKTVRTYDEYGYATTTTTTEFHVGGLILLVVAFLVMMIVVTYLQGAVYSGVLRVADGEPAGVREFLTLRRPIAYFVTVILLGLVTLIGFVLLIVPGLIAAFALQFAPIMVIEQKMSPTAAMAASARLAFAKKSDSILVLLIQMAYSYAGSLAMVGVLVTLPTGAAFDVHAYRDLVERPVPPQF
ncbi:YciC family protein [Gordonia sp. FQ]|uniref:YciC family protein n=1 Tax=Gordonia sp. FQ TaxID=3446634 RepID=UPI003F84FA57